MSSLARLRALADLDFDEVGAIEQMDVDAETSGSHLLAAILLVSSHHVGISPPSPFIATIFKRLAASAYARKVVSPCEPNDIAAMKIGALWAPIFVSA